MSKWVRVDPSNVVQEVISYNPFEVVNEAFHPFYHEVSGEESYGWTYDPDTGTFTSPPPTSSQRILELPKEITEAEFRGTLKLSERILWENPESGTNAQKGAITTIKSEFPHYGIESMTEEFEVLEQVGFLTPQRVEEIKLALS